MEHAGELTFQARMDPKLMKALLRHALLPIVLLVAATVLVVSALLYQPGDPGGWAVTVVAGSVAGPLFLLFAVPRQAVARDAAQIGRPIAYRIDAVGVHTTHGFTTKTLEWAAINGVHRARGQFLLSHGRLASGKRWMTSVPTAELTEAEQARVLEVLRSRGAALANTPAA